VGPYLEATAVVQRGTPIATFLEDGEGRIRLQEGFDLGDRDTLSHEGV
jgi:hypothetical protein